MQLVKVLPQATWLPQVKGPVKLAQQSNQPANLDGYTNKCPSVIVKRLNGSFN